MAPTSATGTESVKQKVVTVYAASSANVDDKFKQDAFELGTLIAREGWIQLNGGGDTGLMGAATRGALTAGGIVDTVILDKFVNCNMSSGFRNVTVVKTMPARKAGLYEGADAFIALPGGMGTLDELAEVMCMRQLCFHERPIALVNTNGFYDHFKKFIEDAITSKFITSAMGEVMFFADTPKDAVDFIRDCRSSVKIDKDTLHSGEMESASKHLEQNQ